MSPHGLPRTEAHPEVTPRVIPTVPTHWQAAFSEVLLLRTP